MTNDTYKALSERVRLAKFAGIPITVADANLTKEEIMQRYNACNTWGDVVSRYGNEEV